MLSEIERAIKWLDTVTGSDGGIRRWVNMDTFERGPVSTEITGYAAHLFAWLAMETGNDEYRERASKHASWIERLFCNNGMKFLPFEPDSDLMYFFDTGIAARGLRMVAKLFPRFGGTAYRDMSPLLRAQIPIVDRAEKRVTPNPGWWSSEYGPYRAKAALAIHNASSMVAVYGNEWQEWNGDGNLLHPLAYFVEAAYLSGNKLVAAMGTELLSAHWKKLYRADMRSRLCRCDVLAQLSRLQNLQRSKPVFSDNEIALCGYQHESGGFHFSRTEHAQFELDETPSTLSPDLSTHATIFAIQALMIAKGHTTDYQELTIV